MGPVKNRVQVFDSPGIVRAHRDSFWPDINIVLGCNEPNGSFTAITEFKKINIAEHESIPEVAYLQIDRRSAQTLMDDLWHCGIRPTEGTGSAGSFAAQSRHLEDMRRLVEHSTGTKLNACG